MPGVDLIQPPVSHPATALLAREQVRAEFGIAPGARVVLIVGGAWGVGNLAGAARVVDAMHGFHAIVVAGRNESLARQLGSDRSLSNVSVVGWTERMAELMAASDVLIQNAGGVTCLEAFSVRLPVVMFDPLPGHGENNARHMARDGTIVLAARERELGRLLADDGYWRDAAPACCERAQSLFERPTVADAIARPQPAVHRRRARPARVAVRLVVAMALVVGALEVGHAGEALADGGASPPISHPRRWPSRCNPVERRAAGWRLVRWRLLSTRRPRCPSLRRFPGVITRLPDTGRSVSLTFDDGPHPQGTPAILEALAEAGVTATFFVLGEAVRRHRGLVPSILAAGHEIALHGDRHLPHALTPPWVVARDLERGRAEVEQEAGRAVRPCAPRTARPAWPHWHTPADTG